MICRSKLRLSSLLISQRPLYQPTIGKFSIWDLILKSAKERSSQTYRNLIGLLKMKSEGSRNSISNNRFYLYLKMKTLMIMNCKDKVTNKEVLITVKKVLI
jgi:hypothetical protein